MEAEQQREFRVKLAIAIFLFLTFWIVGAVVFWKSEDWTFFDSLYCECIDDRDGVVPRQSEF